MGKKRGKLEECYSDASDAFGVTRGELVDLMSHRGCAGFQALGKLGGAEALHCMLDSPPTCGIIGDPCDIYRRQWYFGKNEASFLETRKPFHVHFSENLITFV